MKKYIKHCLLCAILLCGMFAFSILLVLLDSFFSLNTSAWMASALILPPLVHQSVKKLPNGPLRSFCNLVGGALTVPICYLFIYTTLIGCFLVGYRLWVSVPSVMLCRTLLLLDLTATALTVLIGVLWARHVKVVRYHVKANVEKPVKIAFFSDMHIGTFCSPSHIQNIVTKIKKEEPDLVLFGGDLLDLDVPNEKRSEKFTRLLASLGGIVACEGNHDLHERGTAEQSGFLQNANVTLLVDAIYRDQQSGLCILGRQSRKAPRATLKTIASQKIDILLDHDLKYADEALTLGVPLVLCGHTHRGQTFPGNILRRMTTPYFYGHYPQNGGHIITTAGCGSTGFPVRFLITNEIVIINIDPDK